MLTEGSDRWAGREQLERYLSTWRNSRTELGFCRIMEGGGGCKLKRRALSVPTWGSVGRWGSCLGSKALSWNSRRRKEKKKNEMLRERKHCECEWEKEGGEKKWNAGPPGCSAFLDDAESLIRLVPIWPPSFFCAPHSPFPMYPPGLHCCLDSQNPLKDSVILFDPSTLSSSYFLTQPVPFRPQQHLSQLPPSSFELLSPPKTKQKQKQTGTMVSTLFVRSRRPPLGSTPLLLFTRMLTTVLRPGRLHCYLQHCCSAEVPGPAPERRRPGRVHLDRRMQRTPE